MHHVGLLLAVALASSLTAAVAEQPLHVMSFNVRGDFDGGVETDKPDGWLSRSGDHRREFVLQVITDADPDLLGVQEAYRNQVDEIDAALPEHDQVGVGRDDGKQAGEHCTIYYRRGRFELVDSGTFWLSNEPEVPSTYPGAACPRVVTWAVLSDTANDDRQFAVLNTHWDHVSSEARVYAAALIRQRFASIAKGLPAIVMGDLNVNEERPPIRTLIGEGEMRLTDSYRSAYPERTLVERTFHGFRGGEEGSRIDYILHTNELRTIDAAIVRTDFDGRFPSDHYPVTATLELAP